MQKTRREAIAQTVVLLTSWLFGLGALKSWCVTIAYLIAGPDGMAVELQQMTMRAVPLSTLATTR